MYAEAMNESGSAAPSEEVYTYIDAIRTRSRIADVRSSWRDHSVNPSKPSTKEGMRDIIRRERLIELAFEGPRFWDLRRWMLAEEYINNSAVRGWDVINGETEETFYQMQTLFTQKFEKKDYFWPIGIDAMVRNTNLVQNPGW
jgi:hypothetical protein